MVFLVSYILQILYLYNSISKPKEMIFKDIFKISIIIISHYLKNLKEKTIFFIIKLIYLLSNILYILTNKH